MKFLKWLLKKAKHILLIEPDLGDFKDLSNKSNLKRIYTLNFKSNYEKQ